MPTRTVSNAGGNWNATTTWVGGVVPVAGDDVNFTATSGNLVVNVTTANLVGINFTNYVGTITFNARLLVNTNINFGTGGYTQAGTTGALQITGSTTITSNGVIWSRSVQIDNGTITLTINDSFNVSGLFYLTSVSGALTLSFAGAGTFNPTGGFRLGTGNTVATITVTLPNDISITSLTYDNQSGAANRRNVVLNGNRNINVSGNITIGAGQGSTFSGTCVLVASGSGNFSVGSVSAANNAVISIKITIAASGTYTFVNFPYFTSSTITYTSGTLAGVTCQFTTCTLNLNAGGTWSSPVALVGSTTLLSNANFNNLTTQTTAVSFTGSFNVNVSGNLAINIATSGAATIKLIGTGTWTCGIGILLSTNLIIDTLGTITVSGNVTSVLATFTYVQGTVITTGSTLSIVGGTYDVAGILWNNVQTTGTANTQTLISDLNVGGNFTTSTGQTYTFNGSNINVGGNLTIGNIMLGTSLVVLNGTGAWINSTSTGSLRNNLTINSPSGTITVSGNVYYNTGTLTYITGTVVTTGSTLNIGTTVTLNTNGITWNNFTISGVSYSITLLSDLNITGLTTFSNTGSITFSTGGNLFNPTGDMSISNGARTLPNDIYIRNLTLTGTSTPTITANKIYVLGNLTVDGTNSIIGTTEIVLGGTGTWSNTSNAELRNNLTIDTNGILTLGTNVYYGVGTFKYVKGKVITKNSTFNTGSSSGVTTLINCHKINFNRVIINSGTTLTMNEFFNGSPAFKNNISASSAANYNITFQDGFEKIAKFVNINGATITRRNQLLILTDSKKSSRNIGIRYINQSPNGIAKGDPSIQNILTPGLNTFLISDPSMTIK